MFDRIGDKIKTLAVICCGLGMVLSVICAIVLWSGNSYRNPTVALGIGVLVGGCLASWVGSFFMYGFGELIEETRRNRELNQEILNRLNAPQEKGNAPESPVRDVPRAFSVGRALSFQHEIKPQHPANGEWVCTSCGTRNLRSDLMCRDCGLYK